MQKTKQVMIILLCLAMLLSACGNQMTKYEGTWEGNDGTKLVLREDGTCMCEYIGYLFLETREGNWKIENDCLTVMNCYEFNIYANLDESTTELLFVSDSERWSEEIFIKTE